MLLKSNWWSVERFTPKHFYIVFDDNGKIIISDKNCDTIHTTFG